MYMISEKALITVLYAKLKNEEEKVALSGINYDKTHIYDEKLKNNKIKHNL